MTDRVKYAGVTGVRGLACIPDYFTDADIDAVLNGTLRPFTVAPKFLGRVGTRTRFTIGNDGKVIRKVIEAKE